MKPIRVAGLLAALHPLPRGMHHSSACIEFWKAYAIHERYGFALYDSMIIASALIAGGKALYAEDLQHGQVIDAQLRVINPFSTV
jgi:predicted nucleic acid-binding protein